jgi:hypothetical protein
MASRSVPPVVTPCSHAAVMQPADAAVPALGGNRKRRLAAVKGDADTAC